MSQKTKNILLRSTWLVVLLLVILGVVRGAVQLNTDAREVVLVAEDMAFHLSGSATLNPVIEAEPGETLRLVLVNRDKGFQHDLQIPGLDAKTPLLDGEPAPAEAGGSRAEFVIDVPPEPGEYTYQCSIHAKMMRGVLEVQ